MACFLNKSLFVLVLTDVQIQCVTKAFYSSLHLSSFSVSQKHSSLVHSSCLFSKQSRPQKGCAVMTRPHCSRVTFASACVFAGDRGANPSQHRWRHHSVVMLWNHRPASHPPFCCRGLYFEVMGWRCRSEHRVMWGQGLYVPCVSVCACRAECLQLHYDLELCHLGAATDANALRSQRREWQMRLNTQIQNISLELVVNIFR